MMVVIVTVMVMSAVIVLPMTMTGVVVIVVRMLVAVMGVAHGLILHAHGFCGKRPQTKQGQVRVGGGEGG